jgi:hypothetical protein
VSVPRALVPLTEIVAAGPDDQEPAPGFVGRVAGAEYVVTAVLLRTAVLEVPGDRWADKRTAPLGDVLVEEAAISWRLKPPPAKYAAWRGRPRPAVTPAAQRAASDERALTDQQRKQAVQAAVVRAPARPVVVGRVRSQGGGSGDRARPADRGVGRPDRPAPEEHGAVPVAPTPTPEPTRLLVEQLEQARARIAELEAERERTEAVHRDLIRRARAAMRREVAS